MSESEAPILNVVGEKVALGPVRRDQMPLYLRWLNDFDVLRTSSQVRPMTAEAVARSFDEAAQARDEVHFTIYERSSLRPIGGANLYEIRGRTAMFAISIGEKECWGEGYGTEATRLVLDYGFDALGLHNVMLTVYSHNERGIRAYRRAGFREMGRRREVLQRGGELDDVVYMDCLATDLASPLVRQQMLGR